MIADNESLGYDKYMHAVPGGLTMEKLLAAKAVLDAACEQIDIDDPWEDYESWHD